MPSVILEKQSSYISKVAFKIIQLFRINHILYFIGLRFFFILEDGFYPALGPYH